MDGSGSGIGGEVNFQKVLNDELAQIDQLPQSSGAWERHIQQCSETLASLPDLLKKLGPIAVPLRFDNFPRGEGYLLSQPAQIIRQEDPSSKRGSLCTYYVCITSSGIYVGVMKEPYRRGGFLGRGEWQSGIAERYGRNLMDQDREAMNSFAQDRGGRVYISGFTDDSRITGTMFYATHGVVKFGFARHNGNRTYLEYGWQPITDIDGSAEIFKMAMRESIKFAEQQNAQDHMAGQLGEQILQSSGALLRARKDVVDAVARGYVREVG